MELNPTIWGPHYWFVLHSIALNYPKRPNDVIKKKYYDFIQNFPLLLPNTMCRENFTDILNAYPVSPYLDSQKSFVQWTHFVHNKINEHLGKPKITLSTFYDQYYAEYKPKPLKHGESIYWRKKLIYVSVVALLIMTIIYLTYYI